MEQKVFNTKEQHTLNLQERTISLFTRRSRQEQVFETCFVTYHEASFDNLLRGMSRSRLVKSIESLLRGMARSKTLNFWEIADLRF
jgi:hypothetical protein